MNTAQNDAAATATADTRTCASSLLATLVDVGSTWAAYGLKVGKMALVTSAETLGKTAQALDTIASEFEKKKAAPEAPAPAAPVDHAASTEAPAASA
jgi:hypothetical protein